MIAGASKENFFKAHYEWLVLGVGVLALVGAAAFYVLASGEDPQEAAAEVVADLARHQPKATGVKPVDLAPFDATLRQLRTPAQLTSLAEKQKSFLASEKRVKCKCGAVLLGDVKAMPKCPACGEAQEVEVQVVLDADGDGLPDEWEKKYGLNPNSKEDAEADADKDDFTNLEEFEAKTDPTDPKSHPDYLASLSIQLPLKETHLTFVFRKATPVPGGWRCEFFDPKKKDAKRAQTGIFTAKIGEKLGETGFTVKGYEKKSAKQAIKGGKGMTRTVDVSEVTLERADGKQVILVVQSGKNLKFASVDVQATLVYERQGTKTFEVVPGTEIDLSGEKYKVSAVEAVGKGAKVELENSLSGRKHLLVAP